MNLLRTRLLIVALPGLVACESPIEPVVTDVIPTNSMLLNATGSCAMAFGGTYCWGLDSFGLFGAQPGTPNQSGTPVLVPVPVVSTFAHGASTHFCGIRFDDTAVCWGRASFGQLGHGTVGTAAEPPAGVAGGFRWRQIVVGRIMTCGVTLDGDGYCWGFNQFGEIGNPTIDLEARSPSPVPIAGGHKWKQLAAGWHHACGIRVDDVTLCWGENTYGALGIGTTDVGEHRTPEPIVGDPTFAQIHADMRQTCGLTRHGVAYCWGPNQTGQVGDGTSNLRSAPTPVAGGHRFTRLYMSNGSPSDEAPLADGAIQAGRSTVCGIRTDGVPMCWGRNFAGQLGNGTVEDSFIPTAVHGGLQVDELGHGMDTICGRKGDRIWCWGNGEWGRRGDNTRLPTALPEPVSVGPPFAG